MTAHRGLHNSYLVAVPGRKPDLWILCEPSEQIRVGPLDPNSWLAGSVSDMRVAADREATCNLPSVTPDLCWPSLD